MLLKQASSPTCRSDGSGTLCSRPKLYHRLAVVRGLQCGSASCRTLCASMNQASSACAHLEAVEEAVTLGVAAEAVAVAVDASAVAVLLLLGVGVAWCCCGGDCDGDSCDGDGGDCDEVGDDCDGV
eukprot:1158027-Pelagomonas_calceolata.AAC.11